MSCFGCMYQSTFRLFLIQIIHIQYKDNRVLNSSCEFSFQQIKDRIYTTYKLNDTNLFNHP